MVFGFLGGTYRQANIHSSRWIWYRCHEAIQIILGRNRCRGNLQENGKVAAEPTHPSLQSLPRVCPEIQTVCRKVNLALSLCFGWFNDLHAHFALLDILKSNHLFSLCRFHMEQESIEKIQQSLSKYDKKS